MFKLSEWVVWHDRQPDKHRTTNVSEMKVGIFVHACKLITHRLILKTFLRNVQGKSVFVLTNVFLCNTC